MDDQLPLLVQQLRLQVFPPSCDFSSEIASKWISNLSKQSLVRALMKTVASASSSRSDVKLALIALYLVLKVTVACGGDRTQKRILAILESVEGFWSVVFAVASGDTAEFGVSAKHYAMGVMTQAARVCRGDDFPKKIFAWEMFEAMAELAESDQPASASVRVEFDQILVDFLLLAATGRKDRLAHILRSRPEVTRFYREIFDQLKIVKTRVHLLGIDPLTAALLGEERVTEMHTWLCGDVIN